ncbi:MAG: CehA/McbA family metallohydrolase [Anaerolineae bacterium]
MHEYVGAVHMHTVHSDGTATHDEIAFIAGRAGLDFVIVTDHNVRVPEAEGRYGDVLLLVGEEIHDPDRELESSHLLVFGAGCSLAEHAAEPQVLIDAVWDAGGLSFIAHPFERSAAYAGERDLNWRDWDVDGYTGLELWNTMSEFKSHVLDLPRALLMAYFPYIGLRGPPPETLARWDKLLASGRRVAIIGGPDAHGTIYRKGPLVRPVLSYEWLFQAVRLHILCDKPFNGDVDRDAAHVYGAIGAGRAFVAYDWIGDAAGFHFVARSSDKEAGMGQELPSTSDVVTLEVISPLPARLRLIRHGRVVAEHHGRTLRYKAGAPGAYRVEAYRRHLLRRRGWVFTNPIYIVEE